MPWVSQPESKAKRARNLAEEVGEAIVSRRLARIALDEDSPILTGSFSEAEGWKVFDQVTVSAVAKQGAWREALVLVRSEEHTSELKSLMRNSYAVFCLKQNKQHEC